MTAADKRYTPAMVLPHAKPMIFINKITGWSDSWIETTASRSNINVFLTNDGDISSIVALEFMCQSAAAHAGIRQIEAGKPVIPGFIVGARRVEIDSTAFCSSDEYHIRVDQTFRDDEGIGVYHCAMYNGDSNGKRIASTTIKAVMPDDPDLVIDKTAFR